jgi:hypothetical protein
VPRSRNSVSVFHARFVLGQISTGGFCESAGELDQLHLAFSLSRFSNRDFLFKFAL